MQKPTFDENANRLLAALKKARARLYEEGLNVSHRYCERVEGARVRQQGELPYEQYIDEILLETLRTSKNWYPPSRDKLPKELRSKYLDFLLKHIAEINVKPAGSLVDPNAVALHRMNLSGDVDLNAEFQAMKVVDAQILWQRRLSAPFKSELGRNSVASDLQIIAAYCWPKAKIEVTKKGDDLVISAAANGKSSVLATLLEMTSVQKLGQIMIGYEPSETLPLKLGIDRLIGGGSFYYTGNDTVTVARMSMYAQLRLLALINELY